MKSTDEAIEILSKIRMYRFISGDVKKLDELLLKLQSWFRANEEGEGGSYERKQREKYAKRLWKELVNFK